jgi:nitroreductase
MNGGTMNNAMIEKQLSHRTIREFKPEPIDEETIAELMEVARRTATSNGMQSTTIIRITDPIIKRQIADICKQEYVFRAPVLFIFVADCYRNMRIARDKGCFEESAGDMDRFFQSVTDTCLAAQNVVNAAESLGLGALYLGSTLNDAQKLIEVLSLPPLTFPVVGLGLGFPSQDPALKPRLDNKFKVFENSYKVFDNYLESISDYDEEMQTYYDLRNLNQRVDSFSNQIISKLTTASPKRQEILNVIRNQGFILKLKEPQETIE